MKTKILISLAIVAVVSAAIFAVAGKKSGWFEKAQIYEALVEMRGEEAGDAIVILPEGHQWSDTEKTSYLILKLKLKPEEAAKLTEPEQREIDRNSSKLMETDKDKENRGPEFETIRARAYRLKIETLQFNPDEIEKGQPFADKIFDSNLMEEK